MEHRSPGTPTAPVPDHAPGTASSADPDAAPLDLTALPPLGEVLEALTETLAAWMHTQRWYAHKGSGVPTLTVRGWAPVRVDASHAVIATVIGAGPGTGDGEPDDEHTDEEALYQVPLVLRRPDSGVQAEEGAEIGVVAVPGGPLRADDATRDAAGRAALMEMIAAAGGAAGAELRYAARTLAGSTADGPPPVGPEATSRLLSGEQSNTSMIFEAPGARPVIVKLFRVLQDGENPDVVLQGALTAAGSPRVPSVLGEAHLACGDLTAHALFAQEFLPGVEDAWRTALREAVAGSDFTAAARDLGVAVAEVHRDLAAALGTVRTDQRVAEEMVAQMRGRIDQVAAQVPQVQEHREALSALLTAALAVSWPPMQRIHGDLHLGQVLSVPEQGWVLLDFEGEPLRSLEQRSRPDSPLRDVAGMLRSLDYAAGAVALEHGTDVSDWSARARAAFLAGYADAARITADEHSVRVLLAAFEADKAVYEALYEARNRPDWLPIPLGALQRISAAAAAEGSAD